MIGAVHPSHAQDVLTYLGIAQVSFNQDLTCAECGGALSRDALAAARKGDDGVLLCCSTLTCLEAFNDR